MVGPTGPSALRDDPSRFWRMARRRLVVAEADAHPFADCARGASDLTGSKEVERAHLAAAWDFVEYGGGAADRARKSPGSELTLEDLRVTTRPLARLADSARPFVRGGYTALVRASTHAREADHPVALPPPGLGKGLPDWRARYRSIDAAPSGLLLAVGQGANMSVFRSQDGGVTWNVASLRAPGLDRIAGRCPAGTSGASFSFGLSRDGTTKTVRSMLADGTTSAVPLATVDARIFAASCDETTLVAAVGRRGSLKASLHACPLEQSCREIAIPVFSGVDRGPRYPLDIARVKGVTVVAAAMHGILRIASSRDDGETWTPWTAAYDAAENSGASGTSVPSHLLVVGERLLLYGGADQPGTPYPILFSDDFAASWRAR
jgi:hypothetical protein